MSFEHPPSWRTQLPGRSFHYYDTFAYVANFGLNKNWCASSIDGDGCIWQQLGQFPSDGMLVTFGTGEYGPGPETQKQLLGTGQPLRIAGRTARRTRASGRGCLGVGADASTSYTLLDGKSQGDFAIAFCYRGPELSSLRRQAEKVALSLRLGPGPANMGPGPS